LRVRTTVQNRAVKANQVTINRNEYFSYAFPGYYCDVTPETSYARVPHSIDDHIFGDEDVDVCVQYEYFADEVSRRSKVVDTDSQKQKLIWPSHPCTHILKRLNNFSDVDFIVDHAEMQRPRKSPGIGGPWYVQYLTPRVAVSSSYGYGVAAPVCDSSSRFMSKADFESWSLEGHSLKQLRLRAARTMLPNMEAGLSLPVFLAELRDLPRMLSGFIKCFDDLLKYIGKLLNAPLKTLASTHLSAVFGWIPFLSDTKKIIQRLLSLRQDVSKYIANADKVLTYHYSYGFSPLDCKPTEFFYDVTDAISLSRGFSTVLPEVLSIPVNRRKQNFVDKLKYHATSRFHYHLPYTGKMAALLAGLDRFGINLSVSDIWEIIPFSFVVDWFIGIQSYLKGLDFSNLPAQIVIDDFCDSIYFEYTENSEFTPGSAFLSEDTNVCYHNLDSENWRCSPAHANSTYVEKAYYRWNGRMLVPSDDFPGLRAPNGAQLTNLVALVLVNT